MASPTDDDVARVDRDYVDPDSTSRDEIREDLEDAGIDGGSADAFEDRIVDVDDVAERVDDEGRVATRDEVDRAARSIDEPHNAVREPALADDAAEQIGAPTESELTRARASAARQVDEDGTIRSNPDLDPLGGDEGREIGPVSDVTRNTGGRGGGYDEGVEPTGEGKGVYYIEDSESGNRYPLAEVEI